MYNSIIWDLGGTLLVPDLQKLSENQRKIAYLFLNFYKSNWLNLLESVPKVINLTDYKADYALHKWITGIISDQKAYRLILKSLKPFKKRFEIVGIDAKTLEFELKKIFEPEFLAKLMVINQDLLPILKEMHNKNIKNYTISNWDKKSFDIIMKGDVGKELLKYIDYNNIVISSIVGMAKPDPKIYTYFLTKYSLKPEQTIMIDDQENNIEVANQLGIKGILYKNNPLYIKETLCSLTN